MADQVLEAEVFAVEDTSQDVRRGESDAVLSAVACRQIVLCSERCLKVWAGCRECAWAVSRCAPWGPSGSFHWLLLPQTLARRIFCMELVSLPAFSFGIALWKTRTLPYIAAVFLLKLWTF